MRQFDAFNPVTRRALRINYKSPFICEFAAEASGSGSGSAVTSILDILPVSRLPGPAEINIDGDVLSWSSQPYIYSYVVYYATSAEGPFTLLTSNLLATTFDVSEIPAGDYFFKVTGVEPTAGETLPSPTLGPTPIS